MAANAYRGWPNYETWAVAYEWSREPFSVRAIQHIAREVVRRNAGHMNIPALLAIELNKNLHETMPSLRGIWGMLIRHSFSEVDTLEIARRILLNLDNPSKGALWS